MNKDLTMLKPISRRFSFGAIFSSLVAWPALAASRYPSVKELEQSLNLVPGGEFPKYVEADGKLYHAFYEGAIPLENGKYSVIVKLVA
jgi:hypothetical protein